VEYRPAIENSLMSDESKQAWERKVMGQKVMVLDVFIFLFVLSVHERRQMLVAGWLGVNEFLCLFFQGEIIGHNRHRFLIATLLPLRSSP